MSLESMFDELKNSDATRRRYAAEDLGDAGDPRAIPHLLSCLSDPEVSVREAAADALIAIGGAETGKAVIPLLYSEHTALRNLAMEILVQTGRDCLDDLLQLCSSPSADIRKFAVDILGKIGRDHAIDNLDPILTCLRDPNPNVASAAAEALGNIANPATITPLLDTLQGGEWLQCNVVDAIFRIGGEAARTALHNIAPEELADEARHFYQLAMKRLEHE
ncbi:MAG TPA: HEAT repeat domain-containing protein [Bacteroidetes bacterium]|nr:HEAT repeat domain-containing protein [Bacteroidota bacterium]